MKILLQETWQKSLEWDDNLAKDLKDAWESWCLEIKHLSSELNWKPFVANRMTEIQSLTDPKIWDYISGKDNPSDL
ncbi:hypothetical protein TNCT_571501 [Trichonephila clavata]|uniref:Uncharacterized protein n=1 Tax=Trichonephila clavata TaxID=2740835 RepID=A0A8X6I1K3_TRICU|nr:hypothetical protein TNCT_571501 [Trichonephila clavata]